MAALISSRIQVRPISGFDTRITVKGTTVKLRYNVFLRTEKNSTLYPRYAVTM